MGERDKKTELEVLDVHDLDRPEDNLWVVSADHADLSRALSNAIVHGESARFIVHRQVRFNIPSVPG